MRGSCGQQTEFGQEIVQILPDGESVVRSLSETINALEGETREELLRRLARDFDVQPHDRVRVTYKSGKPKCAAVERRSKPKR